MFFVDKTLDQISFLR